MSMCVCLHVRYSADNPPSMNQSLTQPSLSPFPLHTCSWAVGLASAQRQDAEWFGPDCSMRHCASADDPLTAVDDTDCAGKRRG